MNTKEGIKLILSASRRTDIIAFYMDWFMNRLKEGYVLVRNPMNYHQVSKIELNPDVIDCIVFWTKNPANILDKLDMISEYKYYFQITINGYSKDIEHNVPSLDLVIESFKKLSKSIGKEKTIWRYDPILLTDKIDIEYHCNRYEEIASKLEGYTDRCVISFVDLYKKTERNMRNLRIKNFDSITMLKIGRRLSEIARRHGFIIETCSEKIDLLSVGIEHGKCIDDKLISKIVGNKIKVNKDKNQRDVCGCVESIDIGAYNTCKHSCLYCYANYSEMAVKNNILNHNPKSPLLIGEREKDDIIYKRDMKSYIDKQMSIFDV